MTNRTYSRTTIAVWEITLACNLSCGHCGSRAGRARERELTTDEALDLIGQLAATGIREVALIGGEAYLRADWLGLVRAITNAGMVCSMTTGGFGVSAEVARRMADAGMRHVSVSIDGLRETHDRIRGRTGSFDAALRTIGHLRNAGLLVGANTQINRLSAPELPQVYEQLRESGVGSWQVQLTVPTGRAADRPAWLLQPCELPQLFDVLARIAIRALADGMALMPGNNIGYHSAYADLFARAGGVAAGEGCMAGLDVLGIEADGTVKGCPSLPAAAYGGGSVRDRSLQDMLATADGLAFNTRARQAPTVALWGFCGTCEFAARCRGGCTWTAHSLFGRPGNNPYCHHRAEALARRGRRERVVQIAAAPGEPFDNALFQLIQEPLDAPWPDADGPFNKATIAWPERQRRRHDRSLANAMAEGPGTWTTSTDSPT